LARNFESQGYKYTYGGSENFYVNPLQHWNDGKFDSISYAESLGKDEYGKYYNNDEFDYAKYFNDYLVNPFASSDSHVLSGILGYKGKLIDSGDLQGMYYIPQENDTKRSSALVYDPNTNRLFYTFIGRIPHVWDKLENKYNRTGSWQSEFYKEGGKFQLGGNINAEVKSIIDSETKSRADAEGVSEEEYKAAKRKVASSGDAYNPKGFSGTDIARLASIAADITSMFLDPVTGTAVGLGSSLTNFGADWAEDGLQWNDVKNLGINVSFDLLGAIPIFGDAVGTGTKITRQLLKWAPRIMTGLAAYQGVANFDGMMGSWKKLTSSDSDAKMTVQDWRNVAQSIGLITGVTRGIKNKMTQSKIKKQAKVDGVVGVSVRDKNTGEVKQLLVDGETAKNIRKHKGDKTEIEKELSQLESLKDKFGENGTFEIVT
jgi:hypothetical protein